MTATEIIATMRAKPFNQPLWDILTRNSDIADYTTELPVSGDEWNAVIALSWDDDLYVIDAVLVCGDDGTEYGPLDRAQAWEVFEKDMRRICETLAETRPVGGYD